jgi:hypothetical protein
MSGKFSQDDALNEPAKPGETHEIKGLILKIEKTAHELSVEALGAAYNSGAGFNAEIPFRRRFRAAVFHLPETKENRRFQKLLPEGAAVDVHSFIPNAELDKARHYPGTITFEKLTVTFNHDGSLRAIDMRPACVVPGTRRYIDHVAAAQHRVLGTGHAQKDPCAHCDCRLDSAW